MPYDKNGKYYRKPVYKIEKIKKDLPLKKKRHFRFYILGLITPYVFIFCCLIIMLLIGSIFNINYTQTPDSIINAIGYLVLFLSLIGLILIIYRFHKSQVRNYLKQGGKLTKKKIIILNTLWWITTPITISIPIMIVASVYLVYFFMFLEAMAEIIKAVAEGVSNSP